MRRLAVPLTVIVIAVGAFVVGTGGSQPAQAAELETFPDCPSLLERVVEVALEHVGPHGLDSGPIAIPVMERGEALDAVESDGAAPVSAPAGGDAGAGDTAAAPQDTGDFTSDTGTNVQVVGVDEPDQVKLSGDILAMLSNQRIRLLDVSGETPRAVGKLDLSGEVHPTTMLAAGDHLVVFGNPVENLDEPVGDAADSDQRGIVPPYYQERVTVAVVDVSDPTAPRVRERMTVDGALVSARLTDGRVLLVTRSVPEIPFVYPQGGADSEDRAEQANRAAVRDSTLDQWVAGVSFDDGTERILADCDLVGVPSDIVTWQSVAIAAFDPGDLKGVRAGATFGAGDTVYASQDRVYVAGQQWDDETQKTSTAIHAFTSSAPPTYLASGEVPGHMLNQFSMDRYEGHLRVGSTTQDPSTGSTDSRVTVLAERGERLATVGEVTGLGRPGEQIRGIRFLGPVGYVVTFRQTDPLYTIDLTDPSAPRTRGELKIPGYSAYLHPTGQGRLLGVGAAADDTGMITGLQVSLFDVADLDAPGRLDVLEQANASTPIEWDHHAFTWVSEEGLAVVPFQSQPWMIEPMPVDPLPVEPDEGIGDGTSGSSGGTEEPAADQAPASEPPHPVEEARSGLLLIQVTDDALEIVGTVEWPSGGTEWMGDFQRALVHDGTLLAVSGERVWRVSFDGAVVGKVDLG